MPAIIEELRLGSGGESTASLGLVVVVVAATNKALAKPIRWSACGEQQQQISSSQLVSASSFGLFRQSEAFVDEYSALSLANRIASN